jgi:hypothetical protein
MSFTDAEIETSFLTFARKRLGLSPYPWQDRALQPFDNASTKLVQVTVSSPNGAGKSSVIIPVLVLGWLAMYPKGRVALTTADSKQLDKQVMVAINSYSHIFPEWKFIERYIETPTGGFFFAFTTNDPANVEGAHKIDDRLGPLLAIVDEAKSVSDPIFMGIDRWTYNAMLLTSSPGLKTGRFYDSHYRTPGWIRVKAGLADCPHKPQSLIKQLQAQYGPNGATPNAPFLASTLHGEFMEVEGEAKFDAEGLKAMADMAEVHHHKAARVVLHEQQWGARTGNTTTGRDPNGWLWLSEDPIPGCRYFGFCDPMTGEQSEGSLKRDTHAAGIIRAPYIDANRVEHDAELVAAIYVPVSIEEENSGACCQWNNDVLAARFAMVLRYFGNCLAIVEGNNAGVEVIRLLLLEGCRLWRREKPNHRLPGKKMIDVVGFHTSSATKNYWIGALQKAIREQELVCKFKPAVKQFASFILNTKGLGEAQSGCHDDWCTGIGMALYQIHSASEMPGRAVPPGMQTMQGLTVAIGQQVANQFARGNGACN